MASTDVLAIAFGGVEEISPEVISAELDDVFKANGEPNDVILVLPYSKNDTGLDLLAVGDWARQVEPPYEVVVVSDGTLPRPPKEFKELLELAGDPVEEAEWWKGAIEKLDELREKRKAAVLVAVSCTEEQLAENDAHVMDLVEEADRNQIPVYAINKGMEDVQLGDPDAQPVPEPEPEPASPAPRRRRAAAEPESAPAAETPAVEKPALPAPRRRQAAATPAADEGQQMTQPAPTREAQVATADNGLGLAFIDSFAELVAEKVAARLK